MRAVKLSLALVVVACIASMAMAAAVDSKISSELAATLKRASKVNILVSVKNGDTATTLNQVSLNSARIQATRAQRSQAVFDSLSALAERTQSNVLSFLRSPSIAAFSPSIRVKSFWITNQVFVAGADTQLIQALASLDDVSHIEEEGTVHLVEPVLVGQPINLEAANPDAGILAEWGVDKILADQAQAALGTRGEGVVVGIIDTGARVTHQDLNGNFRGGSHSWYFPNSPNASPVDGHGHGTHCTGSILGAGGLGVAPGAKWISCKGLLDNGSGSFADLIACGEFMACPHDAFGNNRDCSLSADIVSNSWGGASGSTTYDAVIRAWHAAGIIPVFANGNYGPFDVPKQCGRTGSPADSREDVIAVGATDRNDKIADFSFRGPSQSGAQSPHVSAPGALIRSAWATADNAYNEISGTSMATPHVAGLVALLRAHSPNISHARVKSILQDTADRNLVFTGETCSGVPDNQFPNYQYGYGRVNALRAANALLQGNSQ